MKSSTDKSPKAPSPLAILLIGKEGSGKTAFALQFPKPGVLDLDDNLDGPQRFIRKSGTLAFEYVQPLANGKGGLEEDPKIVRTNIVDGLRELIESPKVRTIIWSSGTKLCGCIENYVIDREKASKMELQLWQPFRAQMLKLTHIARYSGKHLIVEVHEKPIYGPPPQSPIIGVDMTIPSHLKDYYGFAFTDVWRTVKIRTGGRTEYEWHFDSDGDIALKNSLGIPGDKSRMRADWKNLEPWLKGRL